MKQKRKAKVDVRLHLACGRVRHASVAVSWTDVQQWEQRSHEAGPDKKRSIPNSAALTVDAIGI